MATVLVYRPDVLGFDRNGDAVDADGNVIRATSPGTYLGTINSVVFGEQSVQSLRILADPASGSVTDRAGAIASSEGLIGFPVTAEIVVQHGDIILSQGVYFALVGPRLFGEPNALTGTVMGWYWVRGEAIVG
jgi:hypothetical protein